MAYFKLKGFSKLNVRENYKAGKSTYFPKGVRPYVDLKVRVNGKSANARFTDASAYSGANDWNAYFKIDSDGLPGEFANGPVPGNFRSYDIELSRGFNPREFKGILEFTLFDGTSPEPDPFRKPAKPESEAARVANYKITRAEARKVEPATSPLEESANAIEAAKVPEVAEAV